MSNISDSNPLQEILDQQSNTPPPPAKKPRNSFRAAIVILVILIGITLVALVYIGLSGRQAQQASYNQTAAYIYAANTATVEAATLQANLEHMQQTQNALPTATATPKPTNTPVIAQGTSTPLISIADLAHTATLSAMLTQVAKGGQGGLGTPTALPKTGFVEDMGLPLLAMLTVLCIVLILVVRRARKEMKVRS
jgi:LPXTG-motif cell wall-anchored protein